MVIAVMARPEQLPGLGHQVRIILLEVRTHFERGFAVGRHVNFVMDRLAGRRHVDHPVVLAGDDGRIHQAV